MKVSNISFNGCYHLVLPNKDLKDRVLKAYNSSANIITNSHGSEADCPPEIFSASDNEILVLNGNDAKDYREMRSLNSRSGALNRDTFRALLAYSYINKANKIDYSNINENKILSNIKMPDFEKLFLDD